MLARYLDESTIASLGAAARRNLTIEPRAVVRPDDDLAAIAAGDRVGADRGLRPDVGAKSILLRSATLIVSAHEHRPAARIAGGVHARGSEEPDLVAQHLDRAALRARIHARSTERAA